MYRHIKRQQCSELSVLLQEGYSLRVIAKSLGVSASTVSRELRRSTCFKILSGYHAGRAQEQTKQRKTTANALKLKIKSDSYLARTLTEQIKQKKWSPEQAVGWLKLHRPSKEIVSVQTAYDWIYLSRRDLPPYLHCQKGKYRRTRDNRLRQEARAKMAAVRHLSRRGKAGDNRIVFGHWEGDSVVSKGRDAYIATYVERKSGYLVAKVITREDFGAEGFAKATIGAAMKTPMACYATFTLKSRALRT